MSESLKKYLTEQFPQASKEAIDGAVSHLEDLAAERIDEEVARALEQAPFEADHIQVRGQPHRETVETIEKYGIRLELDAGGYATYIHCDRGFLG